MNIEDYIKLRRTQDSLDIFNPKKKIENMHSVIDYVFEYFITYIDINALEKRKIEKDEKVVKYQKRIRNYDESVQGWLLKVFAEHDVRLDSRIRNVLKQNDMFFLYSDEAHFRKETFRCYAELVKKNKFLEDYTEELYEFIVDQYRIWSMDYIEDSTWDSILKKLPEKISKYIDSTWKKYHVNLLAWASDYANSFFDEVIYTTKDFKLTEYDLRKEKNLFDLNTYYPKISYLPYMKNRKKYMEMIVMYFWCTSMCSEEEFLEEYIKNFNEKSSK